MVRKAFGLLWFGLILGNLAGYFGGVSVPTASASEDRRPNVILIITDDQGYGDIGAHGNPMIHTPELDRLWSESIRFTNFHVDPTCSPTRAALMTGRYPTRTGVWHTVMGRSLMDPEEITLAELFRSAGYRTAMFGKWHLGDNYPLRPQDQGFELAVYHKGGGVGQAPDWWGNDYFDDVYFRNGVPESFSGYCTDVWFQEAMRLIEACRRQPFFCYLATNAPHGPYRVAESYWRPYADKGVPEPMAQFYGMITNIDENLGRLRRALDAWGLAENTLLIFTTDNGTAAGLAPKAKADQWRGFNAGMRGQKGSQYEGGHRVPCWFYWPRGGVVGGRDVAVLTAHIDILPTLAELCSLSHPRSTTLDGRSLVPLLRGENAAWPDRILFVHSQRVDRPVKWRQTAVMTERWRFVDGRELYDLFDDPGQQRNVADQYPEVVERLTAAHETWWQSLEPKFDQVVRIIVGSDAENPAWLCAHDWLVPTTEQCPWSQELIAKRLATNGPWAIDVAKAGRYRIELYRWPKHLKRPMDCRKARLRIGGLTKDCQLTPEEPCAVFELDLEAGPTFLQTWLIPIEGPEFGAYFVSLERL